MSSLYFPSDGRQPFDWMICPCGDVVQAADVREVPHYYMGLAVTLLRCRACAERSVCSKTLLGVHGEVIVADEDDYDPRVVDWDPPDGENMRYLSLDGAKHPIPDPPWQHGYCVYCHQPMKWNPKSVRWEDHPHARATGLLRL